MTQCTTVHRSDAAGQLTHHLGRTALCSIGLMVLQGAQSHNDTSAGGAGVVFYEEGTRIEAWMSKSLGDVSNNVAEYVAAIRALERAERCRHQFAIVEMDSMLVCRQLRGEWRVNFANLKSLFRTAFAVLHRIRSAGSHIEIRHIYREHNVEADAQANRGADGITAHDNW